MTHSTPFSVVFLAGGMGTRMGKAIPKQYLPIHNKPLALHSFEIFTNLPEVQKIVVVCEPFYQDLFIPYQKDKDLKFASPGKRRQDSLFNGIQLLQDNPLVCIHDAARPLIKASLVRQVIQVANEWEAAVVGVRLKATIKVCDGAQIVINTPDRAHLWEMQTPQVIRLNLLKEGFAEAERQNLTVTDDVSLVELLGKPVKVVEGSYENIKVTTLDDFFLAQQFLEKACTHTS
jgi:2-C-methyl-D-erythritol 4-phosphate cytidylyltransferase